MNERIPTPTVGEIISEEFLKPLNISTEKFAEGIKVSPAYAQSLLTGDIQVTPELSRELAGYLGMSELFFYRLQENINSRNAKFEMLGSSVPVRELALA